MKLRGLRVKLSLVIIVPLFLGVLLTSVAPVIYLQITYPKLMENYKSKMIDHQKDILLDISYLLASSCKFSYIQKVFNFVNIGGDLINEYLFYGLETNTTLDYEKIYINSNQVNEDNECAVDISIWNYQNSHNTSELSSTTMRNLMTDVILDPIIKASGHVGLLIEGFNASSNCKDRKIKSLYKQSYITSSNDGLFYMNPPAWNSSNHYMNCDSENSCSYCNQSIKGSYYEPRCRNFYTETIEQNTFDAILIKPYNFTNDIVGQSVCRGIWNYTNSEMILVLCTDFATNDIYQKQLVRLMNSGSTYTYVLNTNGSTLSYRDQSSVFWENITKLEFGNNKNEINQFNKKILPLFQNHLTEFKYYTKNNQKMMIAVAPIDLITSTSLNIKHIASIGVVMAKNHLEKKFDDLSSTCNEYLYIDLGLHLSLLLPILVFCVVLTDKITKNILEPIDRLAKMLQKMTQGDLAIDIMATYEPSPLEIHSLYKVFDKLRVVLRFKSISAGNLTEGLFIYSQALELFENFGNERGVEFCYRELGYICTRIQKWEEASEYLDNSLKLALKLNIYDDEEIAKRKTQTAKAYFKAKLNKNYAMNLFAEAIDTYSKIKNSSRIVLCLLDVAENLLESQELTESLLDYIEKKLKDCDNSEQTLSNQKFLFLKASFLYSQKKLREACYLLSNIIDLHSDFIPEIWIKSTDLLIKICKECSVDSKILIPLHLHKHSIRKDIVLIVSETLNKGPISWLLPKFLKSILDSNDRLSLLQFKDTVKIKFNLTKFPLKIFSLEKEEPEDENLSDKKLLYDCIQEGFRQLRVNLLLRDYKEIKEYMIIVTDCVDNGSRTTFKEFVNMVEMGRIEVIVVNCYLNERIFDGLKMATDKCTLFHAKYEEQLNIMFRQIEAYMCPSKEVYLCDETSNSSANNK